MKRASHLLLGLGLLIPAAADAATAAPAATIDCSSAKAPKVDWDTFMNTCRARAATERTKLSGANAQALAAVANVYDSRTTVAGVATASVNWNNVPTWSDADIMAQFAASRDARYMTMSGDARLRRLSWQYPDDGCYARAEQVNAQVTQAGKAAPYKLFAFSRYQGLVAYTDNSPTGNVGWWYHVVPVVKNSAGQAIVLDAALSPCRPLFWKDWLGLMAGSLGFYDDVA
ncbi:MAG TPA: protein-glutamine glutaminase family protein, partial [Polyangia bacterium]